jgi:hypothetical protein
VLTAKDAPEIGHCYSSISALIRRYRSLRRSADPAGVNAPDSVVLRRAVRCPRTLRRGLTSRAGARTRTIPV